MQISRPAIKRLIQGYQIRIEIRSNWSQIGQIWDFIRTVTEDFGSGQIWDS